MKKLLVLLLILVLGSLADGQNNKANEIRQINSYVKRLSSFVDKNPKKLEIYADISNSEKSHWRKFKSEKSFEKFRENHEVYEMAYVWRKNDKIIAVNFTFTSGSGDWAHYIFHRFREDGSLAKIEADLRTFYGYMSVVRNYYFDKRGKLLYKTIRFRDIQTDKPKQPNDNFIDEEVIIYKTTKRLPFIKLVK